MDVASEHFSFLLLTASFFSSIYTLTKKTSCFFFIASHFGAASESNLRFSSLTSSSTRFLVCWKTSDDAGG
jgi:hypothetical protein